MCWAWRLRSEVEVLSWDPDRGNPASMRQGRGPEFTGRVPVRLFALRGFREGVSEGSRRCVVVANESEAP